MNKEKKEVVKVNQITEGVIWQQILIFFLPILFGTFFQQLYNTADAMIVGHFLGKQALAAVGGTTGTLINLLVGFFVGLSSGATVVISQHYGANKEDKVQWAVHTSIAFSILGGIVLTVVGIGCSRWMLDLMNTPDDVVNYALIYMRVYFLGTIGNLIYNMGSGILRAVGDSKRPLLYLIICCMTNIALDFLFVVGLQMGVMGAALATILSQIISAVLVMGSLMRTRDIYRLHLRKISIDWIMLKRIIRIGFPAGVQSILYSVSNVIIQSAVNSLGTNNVAAWAAYGKVDGLFWMMINALGIAATTFVGQNYGAKKMDRVHRGVRTSMIMAFLMTGLMVVFMWFIGDTLISLFTTDTAVREICHGLIHFLVPTFFTYISIEILSGALVEEGGEVFVVVAEITGEFGDFEGLAAVVLDVADDVLQDLCPLRFGSVGAVEWTLTVDFAENSGSQAVVEERVVETQGSVLELLHEDDDAVRGRKRSLARDA